MNDDYELKVWAQMFFPDGSVSQGIRVSANITNSNTETREDMELTYQALKLRSDTARKLFADTNRTEGHLLIWGNGIVDGSDITLERLDGMDKILSGIEIMINSTKK